MNAIQTRIQEIYVRYFNRPADVAGLEFWTKMAEGGVTLEQITAAFSTSPESQALYGGRNHNELVRAAYVNLLDRPGEEGGVAFWTDAMDRLGFSITDVIDAIANSASGDDKTTIANKLVAANAFTSALDTPAKAASYASPQANAHAVEWLHSVTTAQSLVKATAGLPALVDTLLDQGPFFAALDPSTHVLTFRGGSGAISYTLDANNVATFSRAGVAAAQTYKLDQVASITVAAGQALELTALQADGKAVNGGGTVRVTGLEMATSAQLAGIKAANVTAALDTGNKTVQFTGDLGHAIVTVGGTGTLALADTAKVGSASFVLAGNAPSAVPVLDAAGSTLLSGVTVTGAGTVRMGLDSATDTSHIAINGAVYGVVQKAGVDLTAHTGLDIFHGLQVGSPDGKASVRVTASQADSFNVIQDVSSTSTGSVSVVRDGAWETKDFGDQFSIKTSGANTIESGLGTDMVTLGSGADTLVYRFGKNGYYFAKNVASSNGAPATATYKDVVKVASTGDTLVFAYDNKTYSTHLSNGLTNLQNDLEQAVSGANKLGSSKVIATVAGNDVILTAAKAGVMLRGNSFLDFENDVWPDTAGPGIETVVNFTAGSDKIDLFSSTGGLLDAPASLVRFPDVDGTKLTMNPKDSPLVYESLSFATLAPMQAGIINVVGGSYAGAYMRIPGQPGTHLYEDSIFIKFDKLVGLGQVGALNVADYFVTQAASGVTFTVSEDSNHVVTFGGNARGDIRYTVQGNVATFERGGVAAATKVNLDTLGKITLAQDQQLFVTAAQASGKSIDGDGAVRIFGLELVRSPQLAGITAKTVTAAADVTNATVSFSGDLGKASVIISGSGVFRIEDSAKLGSANFQLALTAGGSPALDNMTNNLLSGVTVKGLGNVEMGLVSNTDVSHIVSDQPLGGWIYQAGVDITHNTTITSGRFDYYSVGNADGSASLKLTAAQAHNAHTQDANSDAAKGRLIITGSAGNQSLHVGTSGKNVVAGGTGQDQVSLGRGMDTVVLAYGGEVSDSTLAAPDTIKYFAIGSDTIALHAAGSNVPVLPTSLTRVADIAASGDLASALSTAFAGIAAGAAGLVKINAGLAAGVYLYVHRPDGAQLDAVHDLFVKLDNIDNIGAVGALKVADYFSGAAEPVVLVGQAGAAAFDVLV